MKAYLNLCLSLIIVIALALPALAAGKTYELQEEIRELLNTHYTARTVSAWRLGDSGDVRAVEPLIRTMGDEDYDLRAEVLDSLVKLGSLAVPSLIGILNSESFAVKYNASEALVRIGEPSIAPLANVVTDETLDMQYRWLASNILSRIGEPAVDARA